jgi:hypothetical protein
MYASGLKLLGHRYYDSSTGRFLTRDPIKDGRNWYVYCDSSPTAFSDRSGLVRYRLLKTFDEGREIIYRILPGGKHKAKSAARALDRSADISFHQGHRGGPPHYHNESNHTIHFTSETLANQADGQQWKNWRDKTTPIGSLLVDATPIVGPGVAIGEGLAETVDPVVQVAKSRRKASLDWWLSVE